LRFFPPVSRWLLLLFAVAISSWFGGLGPAVLPVILSTVSFYWYFVEPVRTIYIYPSNGNSANRAACLAEKSDENRHHGCANGLTSPTYIWNHSVQCLVFHQAFSGSVNF
jgi:hypothetical protein